MSSRMPWQTDDVGGASCCHLLLVFIFNVQVLITAPEWSFANILAELFSAIGFFPLLPHLLLLRSLFPFLASQLAFF